MKSKKMKKHMKNDSAPPQKRKADGDYGPTFLLQVPSDVQSLSTAAFKQDLDSALASSTRQPPKVWVEWFSGKGAKVCKRFSNTEFLGWLVGGSVGWHVVLCAN